MTHAAPSVDSRDRVDYQRMVSAEWENDRLTVAFADGAVVTVTSSKLLGRDAPQIEWRRVRAEDYHVVVPSPASDIEIPWDVIRFHADPAFAAFWERLAHEAVPRSEKTAPALR